MIVLENAAAQAADNICCASNRWPRATVRALHSIHNKNDADLAIHSCFQLEMCGSGCSATSRATGKKTLAQII
jgi:hypothetical protein